MVVAIGTFAVSGNSLAGTGADDAEEGGRPRPMGIRLDADGSFTQSGAGPGWTTSGRRGAEGTEEEEGGDDNLLAATAVIEVLGDEDDAVAVVDDAAVVDGGHGGSAGQRSSVASWASVMRPPRPPGW